MDRIDGCTASDCYGLGLKICQNTCEDCDGAKFKKFFEIFDGTSCEDAYPTKVCTDWLNSEGGQAECNDKKGSIYVGCRKTCGNCLQAGTTAKPSD